MSGLTAEQINNLKVGDIVKFKNCSPIMEEYQGRIFEVTSVVSGFYSKSFTGTFITTSSFLNEKPKIQSCTFNFSPQNLERIFSP